jgi:hypothetical protein
MAFTKVALETVRYFFSLTKYPLVNSVFSVLLPGTAIVGLVACAAEGAFNAMQIQRTHESCKLSTLTALSEEEKKLSPEEKAEKLQEKLLELQNTYYKETDSTGRYKLALRLQPWCEERIHEELEPIVKKLQANCISGDVDEGIQETLELFETIQTQLHKARLFNTLSILCLMVCAIGFTASLIGFPPLGAFLIVFIGGMASMGLSIYSGSTLSEEGWRHNKQYPIAYFLDNWTNKYLLNIDFRKEEKSIQKAQEAEFYKDAKEAASQIKNRHQKAKALFRVLTLACNEYQDAKTLQEICKKIKELSPFYGHKAQAKIAQAAFDLL